MVDLGARRNQTRKKSRQAGKQNKTTLPSRRLLVKGLDPALVTKLLLRYLILLKINQSAVLLRII